MAVYIKLFLAAVIWGGTFVAGRVVAAEADPYAASFLRYLIASAVLLAITARYHRGLPGLSGRQWRIVLLLAASGVVAYNVCFFSGLKFISAGRASLIIATNPMFIALMAHLIFREQLNRLQKCGVLLSIGGAMIVISRGSPATLLTDAVGLGELFIIGAVVSWVSFSLLGKWILSDLSPLVSVSYASAAGTLGLFIPAYLRGVVPAMGTYGVQTWLGLVYLGLLGTALAFVWYYQGIQKIGPTRSGLFINFVPVSAVTLAVLILNEPLSPSLVIGALTVTGGVYLTRTPQRIKGKSGVSRSAP
ncbi:MAG: DMT family transporter [Desulfobacterales bacterium]